MPNTNFMKEEDKWYANWFDSPYYHILYKNRDLTEASDFLDRLVKYLSPKEAASMLDLGCGSGRHAVHLAKMGYHVLGIDLSENSIKTANEKAKAAALQQLRFKRQDMREQVGEQFNYVFNLFTSFGYFDDATDNIKVLKVIHASLIENGYAVIDFLNSNYVEATLVPKESKTIEGVNFEIQRSIENTGESKYVAKDIRFKANGKDYSYQEKVQLLDSGDFKNYFKQANFELIDAFGNYKLQPFNATKSDRLIMLIKPK